MLNCESQGPKDVGQSAEDEKQPQALLNLGGREFEVDFKIVKKVATR